MEKSTSNRVTGYIPEFRPGVARFDLLGEAVLLISRTGRVVAASLAATRMFACDHESLRGQQIDALLSHNGLSSEDFLKECLNSDHPLTLRIRRKNGDQFSARVSLSSIGLPGDGSVVAAAVVRDISHEPGSGDSEAHRERLARVGELTARVAHTLKNSLTGITGLVDELCQAHDAPDREVLDLLKNEVERSSGLVRELLRSTRRDSQGSLVLLNQVVDEAISLSMVSARGSGVILNKELSDQGTYVVGVRSQLGQLVVNLLENSRHAVEDRRNPRIFVRTWVDENSVFLSVSDNGCGISPDLKNRIFDPFFTTKDPGAGTGLGLAIVEKTVRDHGGSISVDSRPNTGATFVIRLPRIPQPET